MERIQLDAICFIANTEGRDLKGDMEKLSLQSLELRRKSRSISLFLKILAEEEQHPALSSAYEDLLNQPATSTVQTRSQAKGQSWSVGANSTEYLNSFLPTTI